MSLSEEEMVIKKLYFDLDYGSNSPRNYLMFFVKVLAL